MKFSIIIRAYHTNRVYFRDCIDSVLGQTFSDFELIILDQNPDSSLGVVVNEFFPEDDRITYRHIVQGRSAGFALNFALSTAKGDIFLFLNQHDRMAKDALGIISKSFDENPQKKLIYSDFDEIENSERVRPHFLPSYNVELLRQHDYIGNTFAMKRENFTFGDNMKFFPEYYLLLCFTERRNTVFHIAKLLFHRHFISDEDENDYYSIYEDFTSQELKKEKEKLYYSRLAEAKAIVSVELKRRNIKADLSADKRYSAEKSLFSFPYLSVKYDGDEYYFKNQSYTFVKDKNVRLFGRNSIKKLYGALAQPDVVMVCPKTLKDVLSVNNCGYIFDKNGIVYPACYGELPWSLGYEDRIALRNDVSAVSLSCCLIDSKFLKKSGGIDERLSKRDRMLDLCLRATEHGYRIVYEPDVTAFEGESDNESSEQSNVLLMEKHGDFIKNGDPFYNENLPLGLKNYSLA